MALVASTAPYRQLWTPGSNVAEDRRYSGMFQVSTSTGALQAFVRPSAGSAAAAGAGDLFTVSQPSANNFLWLVQLTETAGQPVWVDPSYTVGPTTAGTGGSVPVAPTAPSTSANAGGVTNNAGTSLLSAAASFVDVPASGSSFNAALSNSFYIWLVDGAGTIPTSAITMPTNFNKLYIQFEVCVKPTAVPASL